MLTELPFFVLIVAVLSAVVSMGYGVRPLLWALREETSLRGTKFGCGLGLCGACTVHMDGQPVRSCSLPVSAAVGKQINTIEPTGTADAPHVVQRAWIEHQVSRNAQSSPLNEGG